MTAPAPTATKAQWRAWARTLDPVSDHTTAAVEGHLAHFLQSVDGPVLGYRPLPDEVPIRTPVDAIACLDADGGLLLDADAGPLAPHDVAVVLVPGRVFDRDGYRLGRGGGHYDRLLPRLRPGVPVIGITCTARIVDELPREPHDRPMTHLATETTLFSTS